MLKKITTRQLLRMKEQKEPIVMMTAYDFPTAKIVAEAGVDIILVGDSLGMVVLGYESTIFVTMQDMLHHTKAVARGVGQSMVVADIPFGIAHLSPDEVLRAAMSLMQEGGAYGVKIEGGCDMAHKIRALTTAGVPVMGHLGLTPQSVNQLGGYFIQGKGEQDARKLLQDAKNLTEAGIFALVLECVPEELASMITEIVGIPVIGIGAGRYCDGQVLVFHDVLGIGGENYPAFVKSYASIEKEMRLGIESFIHEVREGIFPSCIHVSHLTPTVLADLTGVDNQFSGSSEFPDDIRTQLEFP